jgi:UDP-N-acetylglucosamine 2-epimerase (non-hydrolysing)
MIDNLLYQLKNMEKKQLDPAITSLKKRLPGRYLCLTLHRPSNVDQEEVLAPLLKCLHQIAAEVPVVFPCHPRTRRQIERFGLTGLFHEANDSKTPIKNGLLLLDPLGYDEFLLLWKDADAVLTDSGGLQEETTALKLPCITLRYNTERPITVEVGTNVLAGNKPEVVKEQVRKALSGETKEGTVPEFWDGRASERIVDILYKALQREPEP